MNSTQTEAKVALLYIRVSWEERKVESVWCRHVVRGYGRLDAYIYQVKIRGTTSGQLAQKGRRLRKKRSEIRRNK